MIDLKSTSSYKKTFEVSFPANVVKGSERVEISAIGEFRTGIRAKQIKVNEQLTNLAKYNALLVLLYLNVSLVCNN